MKRKLFIPIILGSTLLPSLIQAQWGIGPHILVSFPQSEFANVSGTGGGLELKTFYTFTSTKVLSLRADLGYISYGNEFETVTDPFLGTFIVELKHNSIRFTFGPQITLSTPKIKLYLAGLGGLYFFQTTANFGQGFTGTTDSTSKLGWNIGGGFLYDIGLGPWLDVGVEYHTINNIEASSQNNKVDANDISLKIGIVFFIGK